LTGKIADAVLEGRQGQQEEVAEVATEEVEAEQE